VNPLRARQVPPSAVLLIVGAVGCFAILDAMIKFLTQRYPVPLLVFARWGIQAVAIVIWCGPTLRLGLLRTAQPGLQIVRGVVLIASSLCFVNALKWLPLADATAVNYSTPILVILLAVAFLGERMTPQRWAFVAAGFVGMLLIVRPGASMLQGAALLALAAAAFYGVYQILTRKLRGDDPRVTLFYPALCGTIVMSVLLPFVDHAADMPWLHVAMLVGGGILGTVGHFLFILAFNRAPASALTPFTYLQLVWAMLLGWIVFGDFPGRYSLAGMAIIAASGLLLAWHERRRMPAVEEPPAVD
jgi:drug/metabolite transporter (DMT)-like permease